MMSKKVVKNMIFVISVCCIFTCFFPSAAGAVDRIMLGSDSTGLFPGMHTSRFTPGKTPPAGSGGAGPGIPASPAGLTRIPGTAVVWKIDDVRPISGNDPVNPVKPLLNYNGQDAATVEELIQIVKTGEGGGDTSGCTGTVTGQTAPDSTADYKFASFSLDPATGNCSRNLMGGDSNGNILLHTMDDYHWTDDHHWVDEGRTLFMICAFHEDGWHIEGAASCIEIPFTGSKITRIFTVKSETNPGLRVEITVSASGSSAAPTITVVSIRKL